MNNSNETLLRFITCGSVDDGKSTLIGRILFDTKTLFEDKLNSLENESKKYGTTGENLDLALLVDGLQSEREQGITIDVAYLFFNSKRRKYIIADTPGHEQYTRNMATGASSADVAIILIDARKGVLSQTKRHAYICNLLGVKHVIVAINKMDIVDFSQAVFEKIKSDFDNEISLKLDFKDLKFIPISALNGDNVVDRSLNTSWYFGDTLLDMLDSIELKSDYDKRFRFSVQYVNRPNLNFRGFCGTISGGEIKAGESIIVLPSGKKSTIKEIIPPQAAKNPIDFQDKTFGVNDSITITTVDEVDISRGDMIVKEDELPHIDECLKAKIIWMSEERMQVNKKYLFKLGMQTTSGIFQKIEHKIDVNNYKEMESSELELNDIALCDIAFDKKIIFDLYRENRFSGSFIVIDKITNNTLGAGMIEGLSHKIGKKSEFSEFEVELNALIRRHFPHWESKVIS